METIPWNDFSKIELRVSKVRSAEIFAEARKPAYILHVDFGAEIGIRKSSDQLTALSPPNELVGRLVAEVVNFPKKTDWPVDVGVPHHRLCQREQRDRPQCS